MPEPLLTRYMQPLIAGRRAECFSLVADALAAGQSAEEIICDVIWPAMVQVDRLFRDDRINSAAEHMACRINRAVSGQLQPRLNQEPRNQKRVLVTCGVGDQEELGAGVVADLLQADGWEVFHIGGGVPEDEVLTMVGQVRPEVLVLFATRPEDVPDTRRLVEMIRDVGVCPTMNIVVSGGIYNRADGLWQEVGADLFSPSPRELRATLRDLAPRQPHAQRVAVVKKRRRRRKSGATAGEPASASAAAEQASTGVPAEHASPRAAAEPASPRCSGESASPRAAAQHAPRRTPAARGATSRELATADA